LKTKRGSSRNQSAHLDLLSCAVAACVLLAANGALAQGPAKITLDEAIQMTLEHNHNLLAARTTIQQSEAEEITADLRPNPVFFTDWDYLPLFAPSAMNSTYLHDSTEADMGLSYLIERGKKRQHRLQAAKDVTAVTRSVVADNQRTLTYQVSSLFIGVQLAESMLDLAQQDLKSYQNTVDIAEDQAPVAAVSK
jgi:cobalt-zinc-cadmium efflux system outer membrane protein